MYAINVQCTCWWIIIQLNKTSKSGLKILMQTFGPVEDPEPDLCMYGTAVSQGK